MYVALVVLYCMVLVVLCAYGAHRAHLAITCMRHGRRLEELGRLVDAGPDSELPHVTIQLPLYNEATVARRLIEATGGMDYPHDRLEIQVLDDSSDETASIARRRQMPPVPEKLNMQLVAKRARFSTRW